MIQAAGRAIRNESDRAVIVFMDKRYKWSAYQSIISASMKVSERSDYLDGISEFFLDREAVGSDSTVLSAR